MITITSKVNPAYSVTVFPESQYGNGNGYFYHYSIDNCVITPSDLPKEIKDELKPLAEEEWAK